MREHVKILGVLHIAWSSMMLVGALIVMVVFGGIAGGITYLPEVAADPEAAMAGPIVGLVGSAIVAILLILALPGLIVGIGLLKFHSWARIGGIVLSVLSLFNVPIGTALGIYGLWVLLHPTTEPLFQLQAPWYPAGEV